MEGKGDSRVPAQSDDSQVKLHCCLLSFPGYITPNSFIMDRQAIR